MTTDHPLPGSLTDLGPELRHGLRIPCEEPAVTETNLVQNQLLKASKANQQLFTVKPEHPFLFPLIWTLTVPHLHLHEVE